MSFAGGDEVAGDGPQFIVEGVVFRVRRAEAAGLDADGGSAAAGPDVSCGQGSAARRSRARPRIRIQAWRPTWQGITAGSRPVT